ncbi:MAG: hypothetical protein GF411_05675 [Candidatus Lokiarchaeota archaeon]|nr:hypothetical protein [Candidatus Lokiarchaeota archaeon]
MVPPGFGKEKINLETLKAREVIFSLFGSRGLEPVGVEIDTLLSFCMKCESYIEAKNAFYDFVLRTSLNQIKSGNSLFFQYDLSLIPELTEVEKIRTEKLNEIVIPVNDEIYDIRSLWYTEYGRQALVDSCIRGFVVDKDEFENIILVLQTILQKEVKITIEESEKTIPKTPPRLYPLYSNLLDALISHDIFQLQELGSEHCTNTLVYHTRLSSSAYKRLPTSFTYSRFLELIKAHVRVRSLFSISLLEELIHSKIQRIAAPAISALGNIYHPSSVSVLADFICESRNSTLVSQAIRALETVRNRTTETDHILLHRMKQSDCINSSKLRVLLKR